MTNSSEHQKYTNVPHKLIYT